MLPFTATIQSAFDYISIQVLKGGKYRVEYKISWENSREDNTWYEIYDDCFRVFSDQVIMVSDKLVAEGKD